jgi:hypothetical protein
MVAGGQLGAGELVGVEVLGEVAGLAVWLAVGLVGVGGG